MTFFEANDTVNQRLGIEIMQMRPANFLTQVIKENMDQLLSNLSPEELNAIPRKPAGYYPRNITSWKNIWDFIYNQRLVHIDFSNSEKNKIIGFSIFYVLTEPLQFRKNYVLAYLDEVAFAYSSASQFIENFSCAKGVVERFVTCLKAGASAELTTELPEDKKIEYKMLLNILQGGYDVEVAKQLINQWQNDNKNIITENGEFRANKDALVTQQKGHLIHYLCCELGVTQEQLMQQQIIKDTIDYMFSDDNVLDNTLGGKRRTRKTRRKIKIEKKIVKKRKTKTKKPVKKIQKTKRRKIIRRKTYKVKGKK